MARFLDTNILIRYMTGDDEEKADACLQLLLRAARGEEVLVTSDLVIFETVFTLQSRRQYGLPMSRIRELVEPIVTMRSLRLPRKSIYPRAFDLCDELRIDFVDAFNIAYMEAQGIHEVYSYDRDFDRAEGVSRIEPTP